MNKKLLEDDFRMFPEYTKPTWMNTTTAYIPTTFTVPLQLNVGEQWYVKFPEVTTVTEIQILDITKHTVLVEEVPIDGTWGKRFKKTDLEFVEKVEKNNG